MHSTILAYMLSLVEMNKITVPLGPNITALQNMIFVQDFLAKLLKAAFPHLNEYAHKLSCGIYLFFFIICTQLDILFKKNF